MQRACGYIPATCPHLTCFPVGFPFSVGSINLISLEIFPPQALCSQEADEGEWNAKQPQSPEPGTRINNAQQTMGSGCDTRAQRVVLAP